MLYVSLCKFYFFLPIIFLSFNYVDTRGATLSYFIVF